MKFQRWISWGLAALVPAGLLYFFPLFHVVPLDLAKMEAAKKEFHADRFAETFWNDSLMKSLDKAVDIAELLPAIRTDAREAEDRYAAHWGVGQVYYYFLQGEGRVLSVEDDIVGLACTPDGQEADVSVNTGMIFGHAIRNATELIDRDEFANSQHLNQVSQEINRKVETEVLPPFRETVTVGSTVRFVGCAAVQDEEVDLRPLRLVPIKLEVE